jgi:predicted RNA-binding Zn ribbon-like protein
VVTGESDGWRLAPSIQPGGRPPAPGGLALVQAFINSHFDLEISHGADLFATPAALRAWLVRRGLIAADTSVGDAELERAIAVREGLRELARRTGQETEQAAQQGARQTARRNGRQARPTGALNREGDGAPPALSLLNDAAGGARVELRFSPSGPRFVRVAGDGVAGAIGLVLGLTAESMLDGTWTRLKVCPGDDCGWAFFDHSRNQTGRWCSMSVCGGRAKAKSHYNRRRRG